MSITFPEAAIGSADEPERRPSDSEPISYHLTDPALKALGIEVPNNLPCIEGGLNGRCDGSDCGPGRISDEPVHQTPSRAAGIEGLEHTLRFHTAHYPDDEPRMWIDNGGDGVELDVDGADRAIEALAAHLERMREERNELAAAVDRHREERAPKSPCPSWCAGQDELAGEHESEAIVLPLPRQLARALGGNDDVLFAFLAEDDKVNAGVSLSLNSADAGVMFDLTSAGELAELEKFFDGLITFAARGRQMVRLGLEENSRNTEGQTGE